TLSAQDLDLLAREIDRHFERLASGPDGQVLELNGSIPSGLPRRFLVTVAERDRRCPTLVLEAVSPPPSEAGGDEAGEPPSDLALSGPGRWQGQFLGEL